MECCKKSCYADALLGVWQWRWIYIYIYIYIWLWSVMKKPCNVVSLLVNEDMECCNTVMPC